MEFWVVVELVAVVASGGDDFGVVVVDIGWDAWEIGDFGFWWLDVPIVGLADVFELVVDIVGIGVLEGVFSFLVGDPIALWLLCVRELVGTLLLLSGTAVRSGASSGFLFDSESISHFCFWTYCGW